MDLQDSIQARLPQSCTCTCQLLPTPLCSPSPEGPEIDSSAIEAPISLFVLSGVHPCQPLQDHCTPGCFLCLSFSSPVLTHLEPNVTSLRPLLKDQLLGPQTPHSKHNLHRTPPLLPASPFILHPVTHKRQVSFSASLVGKGQLPRTGPNLEGFL